MCLQNDQFSKRKVVPLFTNKASRDEKIILTEEEEKHISDDIKIC